jgi:hypothetical protein
MEGLVLVEANMEIVRLRVHPITRLSRDVHWSRARGDTVISHCGSIS